MQITFTTISAFPSTEGFEMQMNIGGADLVNDLSIVTNMPTIASDKEINCFSQFSTDS